MIKRLLGRTAILLALIIAAFFAMDFIIWLGQRDVIDLASRFPELFMGLKAAAILAWADMSIMWIRIVLSPRLDVQTVGANASAIYEQRAIVYAIHKFEWMVRLIAFIVLYGLL